MLKNLTKQTRNHWDLLASEKSKRDFTLKSWGGIPKIAINHNYLTTNNPNYYWIDYVRDKYFENGYAGHTLSLGCGEGYIERLFKERGFTFASITGIDLSEKCIEAARDRAQRENISPSIKYLSMDLNKYKPQPQTYDFIFFFHSLHHVKSLESILQGCAEAIRPGGVLMVNEFVGPSRFQWTDQQLKAANVIFRMLPEELRYDLNQKEVKNEIKPMSIEEMISHDESEAVRSAEIDGILKRYFDILEEKNWGGTINNLIFADTAGNYDPNDKYHNAIVDLLIQHENVLIENCILPSDFKFYMAKPKECRDTPDNKI